MRNRFDDQLDVLNGELISMGALCEKIITSVITALENNDKSSDNNKVIIDDIAKYEGLINHKERDIESLCLKLLLSWQPVASDLRFISAALKMITDMERIGDQAFDISDMAGYIVKTDTIELQKVRLMANEVTKMVTSSIEAFVKKDVSLAQVAIKSDDVVDDYFNEIKKSLVNLISTKPDEGEYVLDILMVAKYFERIGDHAVNIAEWVVFAVTGNHNGGN